MEVEGSDRGCTVLGKAVGGDVSPNVHLIGLPCIASR